MKGTALLTNRQYYCMPTTTLHYTPRRTHNKMTYSISQDCCLHYLPRFATVSINISCGGILQAIIPPIPKRMPTNVTGTQKLVGSAQNWSREWPSCTTFHTRPSFLHHSGLAALLTSLQSLLLNTAHVNATTAGW